MSVLDTYKTIDTYGTNIGGDDLDKLLVELFKVDILTDNINIEFDEADWLSLKARLTDVKHNIQKYKKDQSFSYRGVVYTLTVDMYRKAVYTAFKKTLYMIDAILEKYDSTTLNMLLVGGSTRDPYLIEILNKHIQMRGYNISILPITYDQDKLVAEGAAYAAYLYETGQLKIVTDVTDSIGIAMYNEDLDRIAIDNILDRNTIIPTTGGIMCASRKGDSKVTIDIYKGQNTDDVPDKSKKIGAIEWEVSNPNREHYFNVDVEVDANGVATVIVQEFGDSREQKVTIS